MATHLASTTLVTSLAVLLWCGVEAARADGCVSPAQQAVPVKVVNIVNNSTAIPIWVVLETAKQDLLDDQGRPHDRWLQAEFDPTPGTYASTYLYRTYINPTGGIPPRGSVSVTVPFYTQLVKSPCPDTADQYINWWRALRIYVYDDPGGIKHAYDTDTNPANAAVINSPKDSALPSCPACAAPLVVYRNQQGGDQHGVSLPPTDPSQLLEFTFATVTAAPLPLKIDHGFVDYDISSVDQVYLPVAMDPINNPFVGYIGSVLQRDDFGDRLSQFKTDFGWPRYNWPDYVTNQDNIRIPATYNVMQEIAFPGSPPPMVPAGAAIKALPVIQAMEKLWDDCCGSGWPESGTCGKSQATATCTSQAKVAGLFEKNYANYAQLCAAPLPLTRDFMLAHVYGWVPFNECSTGVVNELKDTPGFDAAGYHATANAYVDLQYHSPPDPSTFGDFNRYVELIHSVKYLRVGEYAFSIDDAAGNMLEVGDGINITVGGPKGLGNSNPYDPWRFFLFNVGSAPATGPVWTKYRICTADDGPDCPSLAPDRVVKEADRQNGIVGYAGIKIGAVDCPCVIVLQDSLNSLYRVLVKRLPAPPPAHPINQEGDPPTSDDPSWIQKNGTDFANVSCFDNTTSFVWCGNLIPAKVFDDQTQRTVYHVNTSAPVAPQPGVRFKPGDIVGTLSSDRTSVTVAWPTAITQPAGRQVTYELTLWDRANCPSDGAPCDHHASIPPAGTCDSTSTQCVVTLSALVPPLTADTLKSLSVVAKDPNGNIAQKQGNFTAAPPRRLHRSPKPKAASSTELAAQGAMP